MSYNEWETGGSDLSKFKKELAEIRHPDMVSSFSRRYTQGTDKGVRMFLEVRGLGVLVIEAVGSDLSTGKMRWQNCGLFTNEEIGF